MTLNLHLRRTNAKISQHVTSGKSQLRPPAIHQFLWYNVVSSTHVFHTECMIHIRGFDHSPSRSRSRTNLCFKTNTIPWFLCKTRLDPVCYSSSIYIQKKVLCIVQKIICNTTYIVKLDSKNLLLPCHASCLMTSGLRRHITMTSFETRAKIRSMNRWVIVMDTDLHSCPKQTDSVQLLSVLCVEWVL